MPLLLTDMQVTKISKEQLGNYVAFPRSQYKGLTEPIDVRQDEFRAIEVKDVPNLGTVTLIEAAESPKRVFQLFRVESEAQFDDYLGKLLGMHETPSYIEGDTSFLLLYQGNRESEEINQLNYRLLPKLTEPVIVPLGGGNCTERQRDDRGRVPGIIRSRNRQIIY